MTTTLAFLPPQPQPARTLVTHYVEGGVSTTAIARIWADDAGERCRLCPACNLTAGTCLVVIGTRVEQSEAPLFAVHALEFHDRRTGRRAAYTRCLEVVG